MNASQLMWNTLSPDNISKPEQELINRVVDYVDNPRSYVQPWTESLSKRELRAYKSLIAKGIVESGREIVTFTPAIYDVFFQRDQPIVYHFSFSEVK